MTEHLRQDYLFDPEKKLWQNPDHFCFNTDTKLLARFMKIPAGSAVYDIGTNNGALLMAADEFRPAKMVGIEVLKDASQIARLNAENFQTPTEILNAPVQEVQLEQADVILSNPPFFKQSATHPDTLMTARQLGRVEVNLNLEELVFHAARLCRSNGHFIFVHRPERIHKIALELAKNHFSIYRMAIAYDSRTQQAKSLLIDAVKDRHTEAKMEPAIWI